MVTIRGKALFVEGLLTGASRFVIERLCQDRSSGSTKSESSWASEPEECIILCEVGYNEPKYLIATDDA